MGREYLTQEEVEILMKQELSSKRLEKVRDLFVFCCFSSLPYIDLKNLTSDNIHNSFDGRQWISGKHGKTGVGYAVPLLEIPKMIIDKYGKTSLEGHLLPLINNCNANLSLKKIGALCGIRKRLTFHITRHRRYCFNRRIICSLSSFFFQ